MNTFKYLLLGSLFLASCSEQEEFKRPGETGGETIEVTQDIQVNVLPMQSIASPATRSAANGKPEKGEAVSLTYDGGATTRVQTGSDPMTSTESAIHNAYIVQFDGTAPTTTVAWVSDDIKSQLGSGEPITCSFKMASGKKNRVYVIANIDQTSVPQVGITTLAQFEGPVGMKGYSLPSTGLPMSAMQDIGVGDAFDVFQLRSVLAKLTFKCETAGATLKLINIPSGYSFLTQSQPGDKAVRPSGMTYDKTIAPLTSGNTYYVPENLSGRNDLLIHPYTRALGMAPANAIYVEITDGGTTYNLLLGDGSAPDFNFTGGYAYNIKAVINGTDTYDLRVGNPLSTGTAITDLNASGETANCYVAGANTWYMFNSTVMGNGATTPANGAAFSADIIPTKLNPASADVLWETVNTGTAPAPGAIVNKNLYFLKDRILFKSGSTEGNAVIAARDASRNIIWSWHIWRINDTPSAILLKDITSADKNFSVSGIQIMDRNLGALETPSASPHTYLSMGFLYQWGRKDPFPSTAAFSPGSWAAATNVNFSADQSTTPASSMATSIASPTRFYCSYNWCTVRNDNNWGTPSTSNTVTIGSTSYDSNRGSKTIYDPCPPGWRVPAQYVYANAVGTLSGFDKGFDFKGKLTSSASIFLPAAGYRFVSHGSADDQGGGGYYWSSSIPPLGFDPGIVYFGSSSLDTYTYSRGFGFSVRCVQEY
ncbi:fimbrial protein [Parabacteroides sp. APC149_11_2_Y6]